MKNNIMIIFIGAPCSGKTTHADYLSENYGYLKVSTDDIKNFYTLEKNMKLDIKDAFFWQSIFFKLLFKQKKTIISDSNSDKKEFRRKLIEACEEYGYNYKIIYFKNSLEVLSKRMNERRINNHPFILSKESLGNYLKNIEIPDEQYLEINTSEPFDRTIKQLIDYIEE